MEHDTSPASIYAIATMDTKGDELAFVADAIRQAGHSVTVVNVAVRGAATKPADVQCEQVAKCHPRGSQAVLGLADRGDAVAAMAIALTEFLSREAALGRVAGVIGLGGSGGTAMITPAMRALPLGVPKVMVSTVAGGNVAPYVRDSDIVMFPSIVDVAGLNAVSRHVLTSAARAITGMATVTAAVPFDRPCIGMTTFGVTTPCVDAVRRELESGGCECLVFHATGTGGRTMEKLVEAGMIRGVIDVTTTEVADEVVGGVLPAGAERFDRILAAQIPYVVSLGALDMVNFGALDSIPKQFRGRNLHVHNPQVTLMRTTPEENRQFARWMAAKLNQSVSPLIILIPERGVSALDAPGQPFWDPEADQALFEELEKSVHQTPTRTVRRVPSHINDPAFARELSGMYRQLSGSTTCRMPVDEA